MLTAIVVCVVLEVKPRALYTLGSTLPTESRPHSSNSVCARTRARVRTSLFYAWLCTKDEI